MERYINEFLNNKHIQEELSSWHKEMNGMTSNEVLDLILNRNKEALERC